jgi:hypothetical protein
MFTSRTIPNDKLTGLLLFTAGTLCNLRLKKRAEPKGKNKPACNAPTLIEHIKNNGQNAAGCIRQSGDVANIVDGAKL